MSGVYPGEPGATAVGAGGWCVAGRAGLDGRTYDTIPYDTIIFTCAQKLTYSQLNLPHGTKQKRIMKKLKIKTEMFKRNGPVIKPWSQS